MGAKKTLKNNMKKISASSAAAASSSQVAVPQNPKPFADFLPLEGGPARKTLVTKLLEIKSTALYIDRIPHGFYETEIQAFFQQFRTGKITGWESPISENAISSFNRQGKMSL